MAASHGDPEFSQTAVDLGEGLCLPHQHFSFTALQ